MPSGYTLETQRHALQGDYITITDRRDAETDPRVIQGLTVLLGLISSLLKELE